ncbi:MAG: hypothetical protein CMM30_02370 [Rhodospirillaceae bacterium]|nr:hypothetical protein [Rhodospirillaceae bacterium]
MCNVRTLSFLFIGLLIFLPLGVINANPIPVGLLVATEGTYQPFGKEAIRGAELALAEYYDQLNDNPVELVVENTDGTSKGLKLAVQNLKNNNVRIIVGPLTGYEGQILRSLAHEMPEIIFVNGSSASPSMTLDNPASNVYRFSGDTIQWLSGLGEYAYRNKGYKRVITIGEEYSFPYQQIYAFAREFCRSGGSIVSQQWLFPASKRYDEVVAKIDKTPADAIFLALGGKDAAYFVQMYRDLGGKLPIIGGPTSINADFLFYANKAPFHELGTLTSGPIPGDDDLETWSDFSDFYKSFHNLKVNGPSLFSYSYYVNMKALLIALEKIEGKIEGKIEESYHLLREELSEIEFETPTGEVSLDENRQGIIDNYIFEVILDSNDGIKRSLVSTSSGVEQKSDLWFDNYSNHLGKNMCGIDK